MAGAGALVRNERSLALTWLGLGALVIAFLAVWGVALGGAERASEALDGRFEQRLARGAELFEAGRFEEAAVDLEGLAAARARTLVGAPDPPLDFLD